MTVSATGRRARRTSSAVAASARATSASPLVLLGRCCVAEAVSQTVASRARPSTPRRVSVSVRLGRRCVVKGVAPRMVGPAPTTLSAAAMLSAEARTEPVAAALPIFVPPTLTAVPDSSATACPAVSSRDVGGDGAQDDQQRDFSPPSLALFTEVRGRRILGSSASPLGNKAGMRGRA
jgi:hypothetical protein